jgi:hypothetical protein
MSRVVLTAVGGDLEDTVSLNLGPEGSPGVDGGERLTRSRGAAESQSPGKEDERCSRSINTAALAELAAASAAAVHKTSR